MSTLVLATATLPFMGSARRGKSLSDAENAALQRAVREKLLPLYENSQTLAGKAIGITQGGVSRILAGGGGSLKTAREVARETGLTLSEVLGWPVSEVPPSGEPRFGDNPVWRAASAEARRQWGDILPSFAFDRADNTKGGSLPSEINPKAVFTLAKWWFDTASMADRIAAEKEDILKKKAEEDAVTSSKTRRPVDTTTPKSGRRDN